MADATATTANAATMPGDRRRPRRNHTSSSSTRNANATGTATVQSAKVSLVRRKMNSVFCDTVTGFMPTILGDYLMPRVSFAAELALRGMHLARRPCPRGASSAAKVNVSRRLSLRPHRVSGAGQFPFFAPKVEAQVHGQSLLGDQHHQEDQEEPGRFGQVRLALAQVAVHLG